MIRSKLNPVIELLAKIAHCDTMIHRWLKISLKKARIPEFYTLTKIHKKIPVGRPTVSGSSGPKERISSFVDSLLQPIAVKQELAHYSTTA